MNAIRICVFTALAFCSISARAAEISVDVLVIGETGCSVSVANAFVWNVSAIVTTRVDLDAGLVKGITQRTCVDESLNSFGAEALIDGGGWPVARTDDGMLAIETHAPAVRFAPGRPLAFSITSGDLADALVRGLDEQPITWPNEISHHRPGAAAQRTIVVDGMTDDWDGIAPLAYGGGSPELRLRSVSSAAIADQAAFLFVVQMQGDAPTASTDRFTTRLGTPLIIGGSGVLRNDRNAQTAHLAAGPHHGTLALQPSGDFVYDYDDSLPGSDWFEYVARNAAGVSNRARVTIDVVPADTDSAPVFTTPANATMTVGTGGNIVVGASGTPPPAITISGTLPAGLAFAPHAKGGGGYIGRAPRAGSGGIYPLTVTATNRNGSAMQELMLTVLEAPVFTTPDHVTWYTDASNDQTFTVAVAGFPKPQITWSTWTPPWLEIRGGVGSAQIVGHRLDTDDPSLSRALNPVSLTATNAAGSVTQRFTVIAETFLRCDAPAHVECEYCWMLDCVKGEPCRFTCHPPAGQHPTYTVGGDASPDWAASTADDGSLVMTVTDFVPTLYWPRVSAATPAGSFDVRMIESIKGPPVFFPPFDFTFEAGSVPRTLLLSYADWDGNLGLYRNEWAEGPVGLQSSYHWMPAFFYLSGLGRGVYVDYVSVRNGYGTTTQRFTFTVK